MANTNAKFEEIDNTEVVSPNISIEDIEGGIKREVSIGCAVARTVCSVCGKVYGSCEHRKGVTYDGKLCVAVLCEPTDAYEFSFVAVPAQRQAGVQKGLKGGGGMSLQDYVEKSGNPEHAAHLKLLQEAIRIKGKFDYNSLNSLSTEARQKLIKIDPETLAQASRIPGISPSDINVLLVLLGR